VGQCSGMTPDALGEIGETRFYDRWMHVRAGAALAVGGLAVLSGCGSSHTASRARTTTGAIRAPHDLKELERLIPPGSCAEIIPPRKSPTHRWIVRRLKHC
jgi:hypothetical protein